MKTENVELKRPYMVPKELEAFIMRVAPPYSLNLPICNNYKELKAWHRVTGEQYWTRSDAPHTWSPIAVHQAGTDLTHGIFRERHVHWAFRAWHDMVHLQLNLNFTTPHERLVAKAQMEQAQDAGLSTESCRAVWFFVWGEVEHYNKYRTFIDRKSEFMLECLDHGLGVALETCWTLPQDRKHLS